MSLNKATHNGYWEFLCNTLIIFIITSMLYSDNLSEQISTNNW